MSKTFISVLLFFIVCGWDLKPLIKKINSRNDGDWVAGVNEKFEHMSLETFRKMNVAKRTPSHELRYLNESEIDNGENIPDSFDGRTRWPFCTSIGKIYDQGHCGSCWSFCAFEALQDRICIATNGVIKPELSGQYLTSCDGGSFGCQGGFTTGAYNFINKNGIVTEECIPYLMGTCKHPGCSLWPTPQCNHTCDPTSGLNFESVKYYSGTPYTTARNERAIQLELMKNGPVTAVFETFEDIAVYKSGVYSHLEGVGQGLHAIKIVGWGVWENGAKYWIIVNSWNHDYGMDGLLLIKRGTNECGIESEIVSAAPKF